MHDAVNSSLNENRILAILRGVETERVLPVAQALYEGGIRLVEITFSQKYPDTFQTTANQIGYLCEQFEGKMQIGAGTVLTEEQVRLAKASGAGFIVSPDANEAVIRLTRELNMASLPGAMTPSEIVNAYHWGADYVKIFPASKLGTAYIKAVRAPIGHIPMLAVGGIGADNAAEFLKTGVSGLGVGGSLTNQKAISTGAYYLLTEAARELVKIVEAQLANHCGEE